MGALCRTVSTQQQGHQGKRKEGITTVSNNTSFKHMTSNMCTEPRQHLKQSVARTIWSTTLRPDAFTILEVHDFDPRHFLFISIFSLNITPMTCATPSVEKIQQQNHHANHMNLLRLATITTKDLVLLDDFLYLDCMSRTSTYTIGRSTPCILEMSNDCPPLE